MPHAGVRIAFLPIWPLFKQLHVSIQRQLHNPSTGSGHRFEHWKSETDMRQLLDLHHSHLNTTLADLELLIAKGEETQQVTQNAIRCASYKPASTKEEKDANKQSNSYSPPWQPPSPSVKS